MAKGDDIQERLISFAAEVISLCEGLPKTTAGSQIGLQLLRSATAAAPNYAEARGAESRNDFVHKLGITFKELNESEVWLKMLAKKKIVSDNELQPILAECSSLCRIIAASRKTAGQASPLEHTSRRSLRR